MLHFLGVNLFKIKNRNNSNAKLFGIILTLSPMHVVLSPLQRNYEKISIEILSVLQDLKTSKFIMQNKDICIIFTTFIERRMWILFE